MSYWRQPAAAYDARFEPLVALTRGELVESVHRGALAVCDSDGRLLGGAGDLHVTIGLRSTAKPFQALALVDSGAADAFEVSDEELAIICASHSGEPQQVRLVSGLLERAGAGQEDLVCGPQLPLSPAACEALRDGAPSPLHNMCSGKHAGMLILARHLGAPLAAYEQPNHEVQRFIAAGLGDLAGVPAESLLDGRDGCGVPVVRLPLAGVARLYALLAAGATPGLARVRQAMSEHPELVSGPGRLDCEVAGLLDDGSVSKSGAEGVQALALVSPCLGAALKIEDGLHRPVPVVLGALLESWGRGEGRELSERHGLVSTRAGEPAGRVVNVLEERRLRWHWSPAEAGPEATGLPDSSLSGLHLVMSDGRERDVNRFRREEWPRADEEILGRTYEWSAERLTLAARLRKELIGVLTGSYTGGVANLEELLVRSDKRGRGVGSRLLNKFEEDARRRGCHKIVLRTPLGARAESFYLSRGYRRDCLIAQHHFGHDYLSMRKDLS